MLESVPEVLNIGSMNEVRIGDLANLITRLMNISDAIVPVEGFSGSVLRRCPDTSLLKSIVDFTETPLEAGLAKTIEWYLHNQ